MKVIYRGHEIDVRRERCMGGWPLLYFSIFRQSDLFECLSNFEDSAETVREKIKQLKARVDEELETDDPWDEKANDLEFTCN